MRRLLTMLAVMLLLTACVAPSRLTVVPPPKPKAAQQQDLVECQALASQAARGEGSWTSVAPMQYALFEQARDRWFLQCMESRGYTITFH